MKLLTIKTAEEAIRQELERGGYIVDMIHKAGGAYYVAFRQPDGMLTTAVVVNARRSGDALHLKWTHEAESPNQFGAPAELLDTLATIASDAANQWRGRCRQRLARIA